MAINVSHLPDLARIGDYARNAAAGLAARQSMGQSQQLAQSDRHFYDSMQFQNDQRDEQRGYDAQQSQLRYQQEANLAEDRQAHALDYLQQTNDLTEQRQIREADRDQKLQAAGYTAQYSARSKALVDQKMAAIQAMKSNPRFTDAEKLEFEGAALKEIAGIPKNYVMKSDPNDWAQGLADGPGGSKIDPRSGKQYMPPKMTAEQTQQKIEDDAKAKAFANLAALQKLTIKGKDADGLPTETPLYTPEQMIAMSGVSAYLPKPSDLSRTNFLDTLGGMANKAVASVMAKQPVVITDDADGRAAFARLNPGDPFIAPDGSTRSR